MFYAAEDVVAGREAADREEFERSHAAASLQEGKLLWGLRNRLTNLDKVHLAHPWRCGRCRT